MGGVVYRAQMRIRTNTPQKDKRRCTRRWTGFLGVALDSSTGVRAPPFEDDRVAGVVGVGVEKVAGVAAHPEVEGAAANCRNHRWMGVAVSPSAKSATRHGGSPASMSRTDSATQVWSGVHPCQSNVVDGLPPHGLGCAVGHALSSPATWNAAIRGVPGLEWRPSGVALGAGGRRSTAGARGVRGRRSAMA